MEELEQNSNIYKGSFFAVVILDITLFIPRFSKFIGKKTLIHLSLFQVFLIMPDSFYKAFIT